MELKSRKKLLAVALATVALTCLLSVTILYSSAAGEVELLQNNGQGVIPFGFGALEEGQRQQQKLEEVDPEDEEEGEDEEPWAEDDEPKGSFDPDEDKEDFEDEPLDEEEEEGEIDPEEEEPVDEEEPEMVEEKEHDHILHRLAQYQAFHPVFTRCMKQVNMMEFSHTIRKTCGNIHELDYCSYPCSAAMQKFSTESGCCFETVMNAYAHLDPYAHHAWRHWQGTLSGKCGVTFEEDNCGESVGETKFQHLKDQVENAVMDASDNQNALNNLIYPPYYPDYYYYDEQEHPALRDGQEDQQEEAPEFQKPASQLEATNLKEKEPLGDEVIDLPVYPSEDTGDIHVPAEKLQPYMFSHKPQVGEPKEGGGVNMGTARKGKFQHKVVQGTQLYDAYDDYKNYQNQLRLREAYDQEAQKKEHGRFFQWPGESWQKSPVQSLHDEAVQSLHAEEEEQKAEEEGFPMAYGVLEGAIGGPKHGYGVPHEAAEDPYTGEPLLEANPEDERLNRLTPQAAVRAAEGAAHGENLERGHTVDHLTDMEKYDLGETPGEDEGTKALKKAGVRV